MSLDTLPDIGMGTFRLKGDTARDAVRSALSLGYRHIDTAQMYGNESQVGEALAKSGVPRGEVFLTTKVSYKALAPADVARSTGESLERLQTEYVDLLLIHWPNPAIPLAETLAALVAEQQAGRARHIGVSNFPAPMMEEALELAPVACNQVEYHPYLSQIPLLRARRDHGFALTAYSPLARGQVLTDDIVGQIAATYGKSPAQVVLRWLVQQEVVAIPKAGSAAHRAANLDIFDFELSNDAMGVIHGLAQGKRLIDPEWAPEWEEAG